MKSADTMRRKEIVEKVYLSPITEKEWAEARSSFKLSHKVEVMMTDGQVVKGSVSKFKDVTIEDYALNILPNTGFNHCTIMEIDTLYGRVSITYHKQLSTITNVR